MESQRQLSNPILIRYIVSERWTGFWGAARSGGQLAPSDFEELRFESETEFALKGNMKRSASWGPIVSDWTVKPVSKPSVLVFDGQISKEFYNQKGQSGKDRYGISVAPFESSFSLPSTISGKDDCRRVLEQWNSRTGPECELRVDNEVPSGLHGLIASYPNTGWKNYMLFDPEFAFAIVRFEIKGAKGPTLALHEASYRYHDGIVVPVRVSRQLYDDDGELMKSTDLEVTEVRTQADAIPDSLFTLEIPTNAELYDKDTKMRYRDPEQVETALKRISFRSSFGGTSPILWLNVAILVVGAGVLLWYRRRSASR